jgi:glycosyltransferase involved in cell wall biosynthesis
VKLSQILFISIDGMTDPLGQSQVIPYLEKLAAKGFSITIVSCEKPHNFAKQASAVRAKLELAGIGWKYCFYSQKLPLLSQWRNTRQLARLAKEEAERHQGKVILHCRSYLPALVGLRLKKSSGARFLFDMRGFWADERREGGIWKKSNPVHNLLYRYFKKKESELIAGADHIVTLTEKARQLLRGRHVAAQQIDVIPCCADTDHFRLKDPDASRHAKQQLGIDPSAFVWGYLGSLGTWYMLDEMLDLFARYLQRNPDSVFLFITQDNAAQIIARATHKNIPARHILVRAASREEVPALVSVFDAGLFMIRPTFSKQGSSPTKMAEILACGIPVVTNAGIGDSEDIIRQSHCGALITGFNTQAYDATFDKLYEAISRDPRFYREVAIRYFSLEAGVRTYEQIYRKLGNET